MQSGGREVKMVAGATLRCAAQEGELALPTGPRSPAVNAGPFGLLYTKKKEPGHSIEGIPFASDLALERGGKQIFGARNRSGVPPLSPIV